MVIWRQTQFHLALHSNGCVQLFSLFFAKSENLIHQRETRESDTLESDTLESDTLESDTLESDTLESDTLESMLCV